VTVWKELAIWIELRVEQLLQRLKKVFDVVDR
jgi:hypothetical protein